MKFKLPATGNYRWWMAGLVCMIMLAYLPVFLDDQFMYGSDDDWMVVFNSVVSQPNAENLNLLFTKVYHGQYSPLNTLFYVGIYYFFGLDPFYFHLLSLLLHLINVWLVFLFVEKVIRHYNAVYAGEQPKGEWVAVMVAFLFGIHPIQVEAVAWISATKVVLYAMFSLLAMLAYCNYKVHNSLKAYWMGVLFFILGGLVKEQVVMLVPALLMLDLFYDRKITFRKTILNKVPFILTGLVFVFIVVYYQAFSEKSVVMLSNKYSVWERMMLMSFTFFEYIFKLISPFNYESLYQFPFKPGQNIPAKLWIYPFLLLLLSVYTIVKVVKEPEWFRKYYLIPAGILFFYIQLLPCLHVIPISRNGVMADRYVYLGVVGFFLTLVLIAEWIANAVRSILPRVLFACYLLYITLYAAYHAHTWFVPRTGNPLPLP